MGIELKTCPLTSSVVQTIISKITAEAVVLPQFLPHTLTLMFELGVATGQRNVPVPLEDLLFLRHRN